MVEKDIGKIPKNDTTDIVVRVDEFGGRPGVTIREFVTSDRYTGFTKSGLKVPAEHFKEFKQMINSIDEEDLKVTEPEAEQETLEEERVPTGPEETSDAGKKEKLPDY